MKTRGGETARKALPVTAVTLRPLNIARKTLRTRMFFGYVPLMNWK
jgi:hypothetical protein